MRFEFKSSFDRSVKSFYGKDKEEIKQVALKAIDILSHDRGIHKGIGLKRLKGDFWEIRKGLKARIIFRWEGDLIEFILAGDHNDIKRFLKNA
jgi:mRNA-degrading endonuclease YafQ of YafQ-DinJ toxin-antitoxin module